MSLMPAHFTTNNTRRRKAKKKTKAILQFERERDELLAKYGYDKKRKLAQPGRASALGTEGRRFKSSTSDHLPKTSDIIPGTCPKKEVMVYSGERKLLGIAAMHKSNLVPVFDEDDAKELARMRRG